MQELPHKRVLSVRRALPLRAQRERRVGDGRAVRARSRPQRQLLRFQRRQLADRQVARRAQPQVSKFLKREKTQLPAFEIYFPRAVVHGAAPGAPGCSSLCFCFSVDVHSFR